MYIHVMSVRECFAEKWGSFWLKVLRSLFRAHAVVRGSRIALSRRHQRNLCTNGIAIWWRKSWLITGFLSSTELSSSTSSEQPIACRTSSWSLFMWHSPSSIPHFGSQEIVFVDLATHKINSVGWNQKGLVLPVSLIAKAFQYLSIFPESLWENHAIGKRVKGRGRTRSVNIIFLSSPISLSLSSQIFC